MSSIGSSTERFGNSRMERLEKDPFLEVGLKIPDSFEKLISIYEKKIQSMVEKGWDTGNDPDKLAMFQRWHNFKTRFGDEAAYYNYLRDKKIPLIQEFILSIDLGGWIKKDRIFSKINHLANVLNMESSLLERLLNEEIKKQNIELRTMAPPPAPIKDLKAIVTGVPGQRKVELTWTTNTDCSHYIICRGPLESPPNNSRQGRIKTVPNSISCYVHECAEQDIGLSFVYVIFAFRQEDNQTSSASVDVHFPGELNPQSLHIFQEYQDVVMEWQPLVSCSYYTVQIAGVEYKTQESKYHYRPTQSKLIAVEIYAVFSSGVHSIPIKGSCLFQLPPLETPVVQFDVDNENIFLQWSIWKEPGWIYRVLRGRSPDFRDAKVIQEIHGGKLLDPLDITEFELRAQAGIIYYYAVYPFHETLAPFSVKQLPEKMTVHHIGPVLLPKEIVQCQAKQNGMTIEISWKNPGAQNRCHIFKSVQATLPKIRLTDTIEPGENTVYCACINDKEFYCDESPHEGNNCYLIVADYGQYGLAPGAVVTATFYPPPPSPLQFVGESQFQMIQLRWKRPEGILTGYSLYRAEVDDLSKAVLIAHLADPNRTMYEDKVQTDTLYLYFLFSQNQQIASLLPAQAGPYQGFSEIKDLEILPRSRVLELRWQAPKSCTRVLVYRRNNEIGREELISQSNRSGYADTTGIVGKTYQYRVCCEYLQSNGIPYQTTGVIREAMLTENVPTFSSFSTHHLGKSVSLRWTRTNNNGTTMILGSKEKIDVPKEMTLDEFSTWKSKYSLESVPTLSSQTSKHPNSDPLYYYYPMVILQNRMYSSSPIICQLIPEMIGTLRGICILQQDYATIQLEWDWPKDSKKVRLVRTQGKYCQGPDDPQSQIYDIPKTYYNKENCFCDPKLPQQPNGEMYYYTLYNVETTPSGEQYSPGLQENIRVALSYSKASISTSLQRTKGSLYFLWNEPKYLSTVQSFAKGDFILAYSIYPSTCDSWKTIESGDNILQNIFSQPEGKIKLPNLPKHTFVKILWQSLQDSYWIEVKPCRIE